MNTAGEQKHAKAVTNTPPPKKKTRFCFFYFSFFFSVSFHTP